MILVRFEYDGNDVLALWQDNNGHRWYERIVINGEVQW